MTLKNETRLEEEPMMTLKEVALADNSSVKSVRRTIALGLLKIVRIGPAGRSIRVERAEYRRYRASRNG